MPIESKHIVWSKRNKSLSRFVFIFLLLAIISIPFKRYIIPDIGKHLTFLFEPLVRFSAQYIFHIEQNYTPAIISDSTGMYIHFFNLFVLSVLSAFAWRFFDKKERNYSHLNYLLRAAASYYLSLQLFVYGFSKVFLRQFYIPEPNTLFTSLGDTPKDLLFWSAMGVSPMYSIFSGIIELVPAILLLFKRTRTVGGLVAMPVLVNVVMVNFGFDISVKLYSLFLLLLSVVIAQPVVAFLGRMIYGNNLTSPTFTLQDQYKASRPYLLFILKTLVIVCLLTEAIYPYVKSNNFDDAKHTRLPLHGAYDVETFIKNGDTIPPLLTNTFRWRQVYVHRRGYLIVQNMPGAMQDFNLEIDTVTHRLALQHTTDSTLSLLHYSLADDTTLLLHGYMAADSLRVYLHKIQLSKLPALQNEFHWTIDE